MKLPFQLKASSSGEALFAFEVSDVTFAQKLRCTLSYMIEVCMPVVISKNFLFAMKCFSILNIKFLMQGTDSISTQEKLDFWLHLPCSSFMIGRLTHRETVTDLLAGGTLTARSSMTLDNINVDFSQVRPFMPLLFKF